MIVLIDTNVILDKVVFWQGESMAHGQYHCGHLPHHAQSAPGRGDGKKCNRKIAECLSDCRCRSRRLRESTGH